MYSDDIIKGRSLLVEGVSFDRLCDCLSEINGLAFTDRRRFFWSAANIRGEFVFRGHAFKVEAVNLHDSFVVSPKETGMELQELIAEMREHVAKLG